MFRFDEKFESESFTYSFGCIIGRSAIKKLPSYYETLKEVDESAPEKLKDFTCEDNEDLGFKVLRADMMQHLTLIDIGRETKALVRVRKV